MKMEKRKRAIDKIYKRRGNIEMPDFQREEVWTDEKKRLLIDSILRGWHLPKFYFHKIGEGAFECVDGQQRLQTILEFFGDQLQLTQEMSAEFGGAKYSDLPDDLSDKFDDFEIDIEEIENATDLELETLFLRLQLGTPLNTAEKLNAISGNMREFCHHVADEEFFSSKITLNDTRYAHFEIAVKWAYIEARGIQPQMRFPELESFLQDNRTFSTGSATAKRIKKALEFLNKSLPEKSSYVRNKANTLSIAMLATRLIDQGLDSDEVAKEFGGFIKHFFKSLSNEIEKGVGGLNQELLRYQQAITSGSTGGPSIKTRINILSKRLAVYSPTFACLLSAYNEVSGEANLNISELATKIGELIYSVNEKYAARTGADLFKLTNKSTVSLSAIAIPCLDVGQYGKFVDSLYFLIYEGSGSCNRLPSPVPVAAMNVKSLRTLLRHDLDHGKPSAIAKKRAHNAGVFHKYSGKRTLEECGPEDLVSTQIKILEDMITLLGNLS